MSGFVIISCPSCKSRYKFDESKLEGHAGKKVKCPKCKTVIQVANPNAVATASAQAKKTAEKTYTSLPVPEDDEPVEKSRKSGTAELNRNAMLGDESALKLPTDRRFSLAVIQGNHVGEIFPITKPRVVLGRVDADITISDIEASRHHARLDILGERVLLRDLNSTNGTFMDDEKVGTATLENQSEFRIGTTVLMLIITDVE